MAVACYVVTRQSEEETPAVAARRSRKELLTPHPGCLLKVTCFGS
jgi:hypothetical protein